MTEALPTTQVCRYCKVEKPIETDFKSIRGRKMVNCQRCRDVFAATMRRYKYGPPKKEYTSDDIKRENNPVEMTITEFLEMKKKELQPKLSRYSKKKIIYFFDQCEPSLGEALELIESDELKDLIKIYMNTIYLESVQ